VRVLYHVPVSVGRIAGWTVSGILHQNVDVDCRMDDDASKRPYLRCIRVTNPVSYIEDHGRDRDGSDRCGDEGRVGSRRIIAMMVVGAGRRAVPVALPVRVAAARAASLGWVDPRRQIWFLRLF